MLDLGHIFSSISQFICSTQNDLFLMLSGDSPCMPTACTPQDSLIKVQILSSLVSSKKKKNSTATVKERGMAGQEANLCEVNLSYMLTTCHGHSECSLEYCVVSQVVGIKGHAMYCRISEGETCHLWASYEMVLSDPLLTDIRATLLVLFLRTLDNTIWTISPFSSLMML